MDGWIIRLADRIPQSQNEDVLQMCWDHHMATISCSPYSSPLSTTLPRLWLLSALSS